VRILLVEDDAALRERLKQTLAEAGYAVDTADNGIDAQHLGETEPYDAIILDLGLPGRPGLEVLANWRQRQIRVPVIILTARDAWHEKVEGFGAGADDYVGKPFHVEELIARLQAVLRRHHQQASGLLRAGDLTLDENRQSVARGDETIALTGIEFRLLRYFMLHPGQVLSQSHLTEHVYEYDADKYSNVIEVYVNRLRHKLGKEIIRTRRGQGYIFGDKP
jgi:two-component system OmpR family response regulator